MILKSLSTGSQGNCYLLISETGTLVIEAGVPFAQVKREMDFDISPIKSVIISHSHKDHSGYMKEFLAAGIPVYSSIDVFSCFPDLKKYSPWQRVITDENAYMIGEFKVLAFEVEHDVPTLGFLISHPESGNILFLTDTYTCGYTFKNLNHVIIEANYSDKILEENVINGSVPASMRQRLMFSHFEIGKCLFYLHSLDMSNVANIVLIHLSDSNSNEQEFLSSVKEEFPQINCAIPGKNKVMLLDMNNQPY